MSKIKNENDKRLRVSPLRCFILFIINPFVSFCDSLYSLASNHNYTRKDYKFLFFIIALFLGVLAFTQKTDSGDICRIYKGVIYSNGNLENVTSRFGSSLFNLTNILIYKLTGNVQYLSLFWVTLLYYLIFVSILNIFEYSGIKYSSRLLNYVVASILCFVIYTQVTEIMKQGIATSLFFYAFTNLINERKKIAIVSIVLSLGIHATAFFFLPLYFAVAIKNQRWLFILAMLSFLFRQFNLMGFIVSSFAGVGALSSLVDMASGYNEKNIENFFRSDGLYFTATFFMYFLYVLFVYIKSHSVFVRVCLLMIIVLNLNYGVSHNFTRLMTMLFPFYIMLYLELRKIKTPIGVLATKFFLFATFVFTVTLENGRLASSSSYPTSFMDNSILKIIVSPLYIYLSTICV